MLWCLQAFQVAVTYLRRLSVLKVIFSFPVFTPSPLIQYVLWASPIPWQ